MKKYHVYGIGNALVDKDIRVNDMLLLNLGIEKGVMTIIDELTHHQLSKVLADDYCHVGCGGSAANTVIALAQFGGKGFYSCKVANDELGRHFLRELTNLHIDCNLNLQSLPSGITGQCYVLVSEDAQRTMNTYLGISETLCPDVLNKKALADSEYLYLEGYLVASKSGKNALLRARHFTRGMDTKIAITLSDPNIVRYFKEDLMTVIDGRVDLLFCNEEEAMLFTNTTTLESAMTLLQPFAAQLVVTCGSRGAMLAIDGEIIDIPTSPIEAIDTVGAGDMFAGAYLYAITQGFSPIHAVQLANRAASAVVAQYGARLLADTVLTIKKEFIQSNQLHHLCSKVSV